MGLYRLSAKEPDAVAIYQSLVSGLGQGNYSTTPGSRMDAQCFAMAMGIARLRARMYQAVAERRPSKATDLLPEREFEFGIIPGVRDSIQKRRARVAARKILPTGSTKIAMENALSDLLGADFIAYRVTTIAEAHLAPVGCGDWPMNLQRPDRPRKIVQLGTAVSFTGVPSTVRYQPIGNRVSGITNAGLVVGDVLVFDVGRSGQQDRVRVDGLTQVAIPPFGLLVPAMIGTFTRPHEIGVTGFTTPLASWQSTKRHVLVVVSPSVANDPDIRRQIDELMARKVRSTATWGIVSGTTSATTQWSLGVDGLGYTTLQPVTLP